MPIYDYACTVCGRVVEVVHGVQGHGPQACETCGGPMRKLLSTPAVHFKGSGWAKKDRRSSSTTKAAARSAAGGEDSTTGGVSEAGKGDATSGSTTSGSTPSEAAVSSTPSGADPT